MPGLPVHHQLPEFTQTHVHGVGDAIQPSHPLASPSPPAPSPSQYQGLFQWVNSSYEVAIKSLQLPILSDLHYIYINYTCFSMIWRPLMFGSFYLPDFIYWSFFLVSHILFNSPEIPHAITSTTFWKHLQIYSALISIVSSVLFSTSLYKILRGLSIFKIFKLTSLSLRRL